jgi:hypothetical protein
MRRIYLLSLALPFVLGSKAVAQTCEGMPSFTSGKMQVAGGGTFADGASSFAGTFGYGTPKSLYGKAGIGTTSYDGLDGSSFDFAVGGGYQIPLHTSRTAEFCPIASLGLSSGPNDALAQGVDLSGRTFAFGGSVGGIEGQSAQMQIVPNASFQFANTRATVDFGTNSESNSESYGLLTLGSGFVFSQRFSLNPSVSIPVGLDGSSASFGIAGAINFGR